MIITVNGVDTWCSTMGEGLPCLVISTAGVPIYERTTSERLARHLHFVFIELRGTGRSGGSAADLSFETIADDLDCLRDRLGLGRVIVWGHSIHGAFAIDYASRRPNSVSHAVAIGTPPKGDLAATFGEQQRFWNTDASPERRAARDAAVAALPPEVKANPMRSGEIFIQYYVANGAMYWYDPTFDASALWRDHVVRPEAAQHVLGRLAPTFDLEQTKLDAPLFVALGRFDYSVPYTLWEGLDGRLSAMTIKRYQRSGHYPQWEEPETFADDFLGWLGIPNAR